MISAAACVLFCMGMRNTTMVAGKRACMLTHMSSQARMQIADRLAGRGLLRGWVVPRQHL
jgi:hypothetical protein